MTLVVCGTMIVRRKTKHDTKWKCITSTKWKVERNFPDIRQCAILNLGELNFLLRRSLMKCLQSLLSLGFKIPYESCSWLLFLGRWLRERRDCEIHGWWDRRPELVRSMVRIFCPSLFAHLPRIEKFTWRSTNCPPKTYISSFNVAAHDATTWVVSPLRHWYGPYVKSKSASSCPEIDTLIDKFPGVLIDDFNHLIKHYLPSNVATTGTLFRL